MVRIWTVRVNIYWPETVAVALSSITVRAHSAAFCPACLAACTMAFRSSSFNLTENTPFLRDLGNFGLPNDLDFIFGNTLIVDPRLISVLHLVNPITPMANTLPIEKQTAAISMLSEGNSIRSIERIMGVHRD